MEEYVNELVENTLKKENAKEIIVERILWYEMKLLEKDEIINKAIETLDKEISYCEIDGENYNVCKMALNVMKKTRYILKGEDNDR